MDVMSSPADTDLPSYPFGRYELRPRQRLLLRDGRAYPLGGRAFDVLAVLVENRHRVVPTRELIDRVWQGLAVEPNNLQVQIWVLRRLLGRACIVTVPRRGYRFVMPGSLPDDGDEALATPAPTGDAAADAPWAAASTVGHAGSQRARLRWNPRA